MRRVSVAVLTLSAAGLVSILSQEDYTERAIIPTKNDRPTVGFGSTFRDDGTPVRMGDTIKPVQAIKRSIAHIAKDETALKKCVTGPMSQVEYDILVDFFYQYGQTQTCNSSMVRFVNEGKYTQSCNAYTLYKKSGGYDCSAMIKTKDGYKRNDVCWGVWTRNLERRDKCLAAQPRKAG